MSTKARHSRRLSTAILTSFAILLGLAAVAQAETVTVGADLSTPTAFRSGCKAQGGCGSVLLAASSPSKSSVSPVSGSVVSWQVKGATAVAGYEVNVLRKNADGTYTVTASSGPVTPLGTNKVETFTTALPILAGEYVEWNTPDTGSLALLEGTSTEGFFEPLVTLGETRTSDDEEVPYTAGFNADIEPAPVVVPVSPIVTPTPAPAPVAPAPTCMVPKLAGKKLKEAREAVLAAHCALGKNIRKNGANNRNGKIVAQTLKPGTVGPVETVVRVTLGRS